MNAEELRIELEKERRYSQELLAIIAGLEEENKRLREEAECAAHQRKKIRRSNTITQNSEGNTIKPIRTG